MWLKISVIPTPLTSVWTMHYLSGLNILVQRVPEMFLLWLPTRHHGNRSIPVIGPYSIVYLTELVNKQISARISYKCTKEYELPRLLFFVSVNC